MAEVSYEVVLLDDNPTNSTAATCGYTEHCGFARFAVISAASLVASAGAAANLLLAYVFISRTVPNSPPTLYPTFLALLDTLLCIFYVLLFGVDVLMIYLEIEWLFVAYHAWILPVFICSKMVQLALPYMLLMVTIERYAWISKNVGGWCLFLKTWRIITVVLCLGCAFALRIPNAFALTVEVYPLCTDVFRRLAVSYTQWAMESEWFNIYELHLTSIVQAGFPFVALVTLNILIVRRLSAIDRSKKNRPCDLYAPKDDDSGSGSFRALKRALRRPIMSSQVRNAVSTTVLIVASYLCCSSLHIALTMLERFDSNLLKSEDDPTKASILYTIMGDLISFSFMATSSARILIYCKCNPAVRAGIIRTTMNFFKMFGNPFSWLTKERKRTGTTASYADSTTYFAHL